MKAESGRPAPIPSWLTQENPAAGALSSHTGFIGRTLRRFSDVLKNEFFCEYYAAKPMVLQCIDPRVKLLVLLSFLVFSACSSSVAVLLGLALIALLEAELSGLNLRDYARRCWAYLPVIVLVCSLPGASNWFVGGPPLFYLLPPGALGLKYGVFFSADGLMMAVRLSLRCGVSLSFGFLLLLTTRWSRITGALAALHVPLIVVAILNMTYRYIFVISETASAMIEARSLRTVGRLETADNRRFVSHSIAHLFVRSHDLSEEIYDAMVCRGFAGRPVSMEEFQWTAADTLFLIQGAVLFLVLMAGEWIF